MNYLPDVNTWLALVHQSHTHHQAVLMWFEMIQEERSVFFCRASQMGLLRLLTQPAVMGDLVQTQRQAWAQYTRTIEDFRVSFAQEPVELNAAFERFSSSDEISPKRWTDDYLVSFANQSGLTLVTCDRAQAARLSGALLLTR